MRIEAIEAIRILSYMCTLLRIILYNIMFCGPYKDLINQLYMVNIRINMVAFSLYTVLNNKYCIHLISLNKIFRA